MLFTLKWMLYLVAHLAYWVQLNSTTTPGQWKQDYVKREDISFKKDDLHSTYCESVVIFITISIYSLIYSF